jgi:hypothetical protein
MRYPFLRGFYKLKLEQAGFGRHGGVGIGDALAVLHDDLSRNADDGGIGGHVFYHDRTGANLGVVADGDIAQHFRACPNHDAVFQRGVAFAATFSGTTQRHLLIEHDIVANDGGFADDDAETMIDEESAANLGGRVDFNASKKACPVGKQAGERRKAVAPQAMIQAVHPDSVEARVAEHDLDWAACGGIPLQDNLNIFLDGHPRTSSSQSGWYRGGLTNRSASRQDGQRRRTERFPGNETHSFYAKPEQLTKAFGFTYHVTCLFNEKV